MTDFAAAREAMVDCQVRPSDVTRYAIIDAMLSVPREIFVPKPWREIAYAESEIPLSAGRALMTPRVFAKMLEVAAIGRKDLVLDVAAGTGYSTAVIARMAEAVIAIEPDEALRSTATAALQSIETDNAVVSDGDLTGGDPDHAPYDVIFVNGMIETVPAALTAQLKQGGRMVCIRNSGGVGQCRVLVRAGDAVSDRHAFDATAPSLDAFRDAGGFVF